MSKNFLSDGPNQTFQTNCKNVRVKLMNVQKIDIFCPAITWSIAHFLSKFHPKLWIPFLHPKCEISRFCPFSVQNDFVQSLPMDIVAWEVLYFYFMYSGWHFGPCHRLDGWPSCSLFSNDWPPVALQHLLTQPQNWCIQTAALLLRSRWEKGSVRRLQRSLAQLEVTASCTTPSVLVYKVKMA